MEGPRLANKSIQKQTVENQLDIYNEITIIVFLRVVYIYDVIKYEGVVTLKDLSLCKLSEFVSDKSGTDDKWVTLE